MRSRRLVLAVGVVGVLLLGVTSVSSAVTPRTSSLSFSFSTSTPQQHTRIGVKVCVDHAGSGWLVRLQRVQGWGHVWHTVQQYRSPLANSCVTVAMPSGAIGLKPFRAQLLEGRVLRRQTGVQDLRVYGFVPGAVFLGQDHAPYLNTYWQAVAANGHVYATLGYLSSGDSSFDSAPNTCKWLTFRLLSTDADAGDPHSGGTSTFQIDQYSLDPQSVTFKDNTVTTWRARLDGSIYQLLYSNTNKYSAAYVLTAGTRADCYSATGY